MSEMMIEGCDCRTCSLLREVEAVQQKLPADDAAVIEQLKNEWADSSMEEGRSKAFLAGHWPGSKPVHSIPSGCSHDWPDDREKPASWMCSCGTKVYRSYADYCDD